MKSGLLLIDKDPGCSSHHIVAKARRILGIKSIGHAGTLDPLASGLLVLLVGEATKVSNYVMDGHKEYFATFKLGVETDTLDSEGKVTAEYDTSGLVETKIRAAVASLQGALELPVPIYSAIKQDGKKLYKEARKDRKVVPPIRTMTFDDVEFLELTEDSIRVRIACAKGGYIRSWGQALGEALGVGAHMTALRRTQSAPYSVDQAVRIDDLVPDNPGAAFVALQNSLPPWKAVTIKGKDVRLMRNGQISKDIGNRLIVELKEAIKSQETISIKVLSSDDGGLVSILEAQPKRGLRIKRVFHSSL